MLTSLSLSLLAQIDKMLSEDPGPDHIDLKDVDIASARSEKLLVER
jgi:hypothetical protein